MSHNPPSSRTVREVLATPDANLSCQRSYLSWKSTVCASAHSPIEGTNVNGCSPGSLAEQGRSLCSSGPYGRGSRKTSLASR